MIIALSGATHKDKRGIDECTIYNNVSAMDWLLAVSYWLLAGVIGAIGTIGTIGTIEAIRVIGSLISNL